MSRIAQKFKELQKKNQKALITFITAGDPSLKQTERLIYQLEKAGADIIELGVPFSDPMADGPVIQLASERALKKGVDLAKILALVKKVRQKTQIPILLMGYANPFFQMGFQKFAEKAEKAGVDAVLCVDLPVEESHDFRRHLKKHRIDLVHLITPTSDAGRVKKMAQASSGFLYYVSLTGVTGASLGSVQEVASQLKMIKKISKLPVAIGFGISQPQQAKRLGQMADGVVVGSALVKLVHQNRTISKPPAVSRFVKSLKKVL